MKPIPFLLAASLMLVACGESTDAPAEDAAERPTVFDPLTDTLDRAASTEDVLRDSAAERRRQLEEAEGR